MKTNEDYEDESRQLLKWRKCFVGNLLVMILIVLNFFFKEELIAYKIVTSIAVCGSLIALFFFYLFYVPSAEKIKNYAEFLKKEEQERETKERKKELHEELKELESNES